ncbi:hypothetical protein GCM10010145_51950 [Streptomyces ruber]|uniref:Secreted protein n=2 Tax=Streptomyces TaxID=1883 RepID=A0A918EXD2_9ACTN|nr:hypothetical protein [Streptomyces ruber]GGQ75855.1 hypothetical protein GCM10010145_51950 [Streptomyces ruber]
MNDTKRVLAVLTVLGAALTLPGTAHAATGPGTAGERTRTVEADAGIFSSLPVVGVLVNPFGGVLPTLPPFGSLNHAGDGGLSSLPVVGGLFEDGRRPAGRLLPLRLSHLVG